MDKRNLTFLFYLLARDHLPVGVLNRVIEQVEQYAGKRLDYSSRGLETVALRMAERVIAAS